MILIKGRAVAFEMADGREIVCPRSYGMIHDPEGRDLPRCAVFVGPYTRTKKRVDLTDSAADYFGSGYDACQAEIDVPSGPWKSQGEIAQIYYVRTGISHAGSYHHRFAESATVRLSRCRSFYRVDLPRGCVVNWRGFVDP